MYVTIRDVLDEMLTVLVMMSEACFDPKQAVELWRRMEKAEEYAPPQFLSTHPSNRNRIAAITSWLDEAERKHEQVSAVRKRLIYIVDTNISISLDVAS